MIFHATFNNISAISWWLILFLEKTRVTEENHLTMSGIQTHNVNGDRY
jgi:hypothetical protein